MGFARTCSVALVGVEGVVVEVQADLEPGVAAFTLVGLPDKSLTESKDRVRAALVNSGAEWPQKKLTVGLSPASVPKAGSGFDLAVASAVLGASERIDPRVLSDVVMIGELGLDGRVRPVRGILPAVLAAAEAGYEQVVVPECAAAEASLVPGVSVLGVRTLRQLIAVLADEPVPDEEPDEGRPDPLMAGLRLPGTGAATGMRTAAGAHQDQGHDLADVVGQLAARTAVEVAAAGGHHLFLEGPPGAGKTMLAERMPAILPRLAREESLEVTAVHSIAGLLPAGKPLVDVAPYCAPHHSATMQSLVGGGQGIARPGAVSSPTGGALPGRDPGVQQPCAGRPAAAAGGGARRDRAQRGSGAVPREVLDGARREPLSLRSLLADGRLVRVPARLDPPLSGAALRAAAGPGRPAGRGRPGHSVRAHPAWSPGRVHGDGGRPCALGQGARGSPSAGYALADEQRGTGA